METKFSKKKNQNEKSQITLTAWGKNFCSWLLVILASPRRYEKEKIRDLKKAIRIYEKNE